MTRGWNPLPVVQIQSTSETGLDTLGQQSLPHFGALDTDVPEVYQMCPRAPSPPSMLAIAKRQNAVDSQEGWFAS